MSFNSDEGNRVRHRTERKTDKDIESQVSFPMQESSDQSPRLSYGVEWFSNSVHWVLQQLLGWELGTRLESDERGT